MTIARQLIGKGKPVKSVAAQVGYDSAAAFSRAFSRVTGQQPREFDALREGTVADGRSRAPSAASKRRHTLTAAAR
jgi:AraC-like DNA-binding protein